jgi:hypothetical protein
MFSAHISSEFTMLELELLRRVSIIGAIGAGERRAMRSVIGTDPRI